MHVAREQRWKDVFWWQGFGILGDLKPLGISGLDECGFATPNCGTRRRKMENTS